MCIYIYCVALTEVLACISIFSNTLRRTCIDLYINTVVLKEVLACFTIFSNTIRQTRKDLHILCLFERSIGTFYLYFLIQLGRDV